MNEEIARILQMLEAGKITADEAERLIRACREPERAAPAEETKVEETVPEVGAPNPFRDVQDLAKVVGRMLRGLGKRQRRYQMFCWYEYRRREEEKRRERAHSQSLRERVQHLLRERVMAESDALLKELDETGRRVLRYALEEEFGIDIPYDDVAGLDSIDAIVSYLESRHGVSAGPAAPEPPAPPSPPEPPEPPARGRRRAPAAEPIPEAEDEIPAG